MTRFLAVALLLALGLGSAAHAQRLGSERTPLTLVDAARELAIDVGDKLQVLLRDRRDEVRTVFIIPAKDRELQVGCQPLSKEIAQAFYNELQERKDRTALREVQFAVRQEVEDGTFAIALGWSRVGSDTTGVQAIKVTAEMGQIQFANVRKEEGTEAIVSVLSLGAGEACINYVAQGLRCDAEDTEFVIDSPNPAIGQDIDDGPIRLGDPFRIVGSLADGTSVLVIKNNGERGFVYRTTATLQDWISRRVCRGSLNPATPGLKIEPVREAWSPGMKLKRLCPDCPDMVVLGNGRFQMGSPLGESGREPDEGPQTPVAVEYDIAMAETEVTLAQWNACVSANVCEPAKSFHGTDPALPVTVSWRQAQKFADWLTGLADGDIVRLPSEAEWEFAARAGRDSRFPWGDVMVADAAVCKNCGVQVAGRFQVPTGALPVKSRNKPNRFGLHDMNGNLWEWTADCWNDRHIGTEMKGEARGEQSCRTGYRVIKGGSYADDSLTLRRANRNYAVEDTIERVIGFRVVRVHGD